ncbi:DCD (Development and Cell Death) domain protein [Raphanus sativus]|nr:DCD (Development and Cell Death) domain protein [Raphanus sativus]
MRLRHYDNDGLNASRYRSSKPIQGPSLSFSDVFPFISGDFRGSEAQGLGTMDSFWQLGDELRGQSRASEDHKWSTVATKLAEQTRMKGERMNNLDLSKPYSEFRPTDKFSFQDNNNLNFNMLNFDGKFVQGMGKAPMQSNVYNNVNNVFQKNDFKSGGNMKVNKYSGNVVANKELSNNNKHNNNDNLAVDKRFKTLPASETLPRNEVLGGYIFVCNNDTMQEDLKRHLFGTNIDATAWEDKKCKGESRFPAQVRIRVRKICKALEEDSFRPVLHHYDGPKFRLELSVPETLDLLDLCEQAGSA